MTSRNRVVVSLVNQIDALHPGFIQLHVDLGRLFSSRQKTATYATEHARLCQILNSSLNLSHEQTEALVAASLVIDLYNSTFGEALHSAQRSSENVEYLEKLSANYFDMIWEVFERVPSYVTMAASQMWSDPPSAPELYEKSIGIMRQVVSRHPLRILQVQHRNRYHESKPFHSSQATLLGYLFIHGSNGFGDLSQENLVDSLLKFVAKLHSLFSACTASEVNHADLPQALHAAYHSPDKENEPESVGSITQELELCRQRLEVYKISTSKTNTKNGPPSAFGRRFPNILLLMGGSFIAYSLFAGRVVAFGDYIRENKIALMNFLEDWVVKPVRDIYATVRYKETKLNILRPDELQTELKVLQDMVTSYAKENQVSAEQLEDIVQRTTKGDIGYVMSKYEAEMKSPIKNALFGNLLRLMLVQVQSVKVDVAFALSSLDKLLKSNELNFAFLSTVPAVFVLSSVYYQVVGFLPKRSTLSRKRLYETIRLHLRTIHVLLNHFEESITTPGDVRMVERQGALITEVALLHEKIQGLPTREASRFAEDLADIEATNLTIQQRIETIHRIYFTIPHLVLH